MRRRNDEVAAVSVADELAKLSALREDGILTISEFETEKERLLASSRCRHEQPAPSEHETGDRRTRHLALVAAATIVLVAAGVALPLVLTAPGPTTAPAAGVPVALSAPARIAEYTLQPGTLYRAPNTLYAGYQRSTPASALALSVFVVPTPTAASGAVPTYLALARPQYSDLTPIRTEHLAGSSYSCFAGTRSDQGQSVPAVICGWAQGRKTFTMVLAPSRDPVTAARLARAVGRSLG